MKKLLLLLSIFTVTVSHAQKIPAYTADILMKRITSNPDTTYIVNFWATWCGPCVAELHYFNDLQQHYKGKPVKVLLVSFDFKDAYPQKLETYIERKKVLPEVVWFSQTNANEFIPKIDNSWSGGLPATLIANASHKQHVFMEKTITADEVRKLVDQGMK